MEFTYSLTDIWFFYLTEWRLDYLRKVFYQKIIKKQFFTTELLNFIEQL